MFIPLLFFGEGRGRGLMIGSITLLWHRGWIILLLRLLLWRLMRGRIRSEIDRSEEGFSGAKTGKE
jgi:hypothetical protein